MSEVDNCTVVTSENVFVFGKGMPSCVQVTLQWFRGKSHVVTESVQMRKQSDTPLTTGDLGKGCAGVLCAVLATFL